MSVQTSDLYSVFDFDYYIIERHVTLILVTNKVLERRILKCYLLFSFILRCLLLFIKVAPCLINDSVSILPSLKFASLEHETKLWLRHAMSS
jgi:hypothetical protein